MKVIMVGGVPGGASCAARSRRLDEKTGTLMVQNGFKARNVSGGVLSHAMLAVN